MPTCIAVCKTQSIAGKDKKGRPIVRFFKKDEVFDFEECPKNFRILGHTGAKSVRPIDPSEESIEVELGIDLATASEDEINAALDQEITTKDEIKEYMKKVHPAIPVANNIGEVKLVAKLLYARDNDTQALTGDTDLPMTPNEDDIDDIDM